MNTQYEDVKHLLDLNDDCLMEILKYITLPETFALLGHFGKRFDDIAYERIAQLKNVTINLREPPEFSTWQWEIIGKNLKTLYINAGYHMPSQLTLNYLQPICCQEGTTLHSLTLHYIQFDIDYQKCILSLASNLQVLDLSYCHLTDELLQPILENCNQLRTLSVFGNNSLKCESLKLLKSKCFKELKVEQNSLSKNAIQAFVVENPHVIITVYGLGYLGHFTTKAYNDMMWNEL